MGQRGPVRASGDLVQLLGACLGAVEFELIPPLPILNQILQAGISFDKQVCWQPFQIDETEYEELVLTFMTAPHSPPYQCVVPPDWVCTPADWYYWTWEYRMGIPARQHRALSEESDAWQQKSVQATKEGNDQLALQYHLKFCEIGQQLVELTTPYMDRYRERRRRQRRGEAKENFPLRQKDKKKN